MTEKPSGVEIMLRSMGMGPALEAAKAMAEAGVIQKIAKFADETELWDARLTRIERQLGQLLLIAGRLERTTGAGSGPVIRDDDGDNQGTLEPDTSDRRGGGNGASSLASNHGYEGSLGSDTGA